MIRRLLVVAVVGGVRLLAMYLILETVDVDGHLPRRVVTAGGHADDVRKSRRVRRAVAGRERQDIHQPRLRGLAGESFVQRLLDGANPSGYFHRRIVS